LIAEISVETLLSIMFVRILGTMWLGTGLVLGAGLELITVLSLAIVLFAKWSITLAEIYRVLTSITTSSLDDVSSKKQTSWESISLPFSRFSS